MKLNRTDVINFVMIALMFALGYYFYDTLPDPVPTHWNFRGVADGFTPKPWGVYMTPLMALGIYILFVFLPALSPKGFRMEGFDKAWGIIKIAFVSVMLIIELLTTLVAAGIPISVSLTIPALVGLLFVILGNLFGKLTKNFWVGIRTPWTLASDEVWLKTHRLGGKLWVAGGFIIMIGAVLRAPVWLFISILAAITVIPIVYSYVIYRKIEGLSDDSGLEAKQ